MRETVFSPDRIYRYTLWREWNEPDMGLLGLVATGRVNHGSYVQFIGLNPSTADETQDDPTIRRCRNFAKSWGFGSMCMTNLFAYRATDPKVMKRYNEPIGPENDDWLSRIAQQAGLVVACWGRDGEHESRGRKVLHLLSHYAVHQIGPAQYPKHPLYLKGDLQPNPIGYFPVTA